MFSGLVVKRVFARDEEPEIPAYNLYKKSDHS